jgi:hypothetical protein
VWFPAVRYQRFRVAWHLRVIIGLSLQRVGLRRVARQTQGLMVPFVPHRSALRDRHDVIDAGGWRGQPVCHALTAAGARQPSVGLFPTDRVRRPKASTVGRPVRRVAALLRRPAALILVPPMRGAPTLGRERRAAGYGTRTQGRGRHLTRRPVRPIRVRRRRRPVDRTDATRPAGTRRGHRDRDRCPNRRRTPRTFRHEGRVDVATGRTAPAVAHRVSR